MMDFDNSTDRIKVVPRETETIKDHGAEESSWQISKAGHEQHQTVTARETGVKDTNRTSLRYGWFGAGQCGSKLVKCFYDLGYHKVIALNNSAEELEKLGIPGEQKFHVPFESDRTDRDMAVVTKAFEQHREEILNLAGGVFGTGVDRLMVCLGAGGKTGGPGAVELIKLAGQYARQIGIDNPDGSVGAIVSLPAADRVSSPQVAKDAYSVVRRLSEMAAEGRIRPLIIVDNDKAREIFPQLKATSFWPSINLTVATIFDIFNRFSIKSSPYASLDPTTYRSITECGGCMIMGVARVTKFDNPFAISTALQKSIEKSITISAPNLSAAKACGCVVVGNRELMARVPGLRQNIEHAFNVLSEMTGGAKLYHGIYEDDREDMRIYTVIAGLENPVVRIEQLGSDTYYRPDMVDLEALGKSHRRQDILQIALEFLEKEALFYNRPNKEFGPVTQTMLLHYPWPGKVTELENAIKRAHEMSIGRVIEPDALPFEMIFANPNLYPKDIQPTLARVMQKVIVKALTLTSGSQDRAAMMLGIDPARLGRLTEQLKIRTVWKKPED
ncbi:MAG: AAA-type ATPase lid domain-containing protein [Planctomycetota bacterium]|jgi:cell division GTPase FtsZ